mgnify:CR=1 FL=1
MKLFHQESYALPIIFAVTLHLLVVLSALFVWNFSEAEEIKPKRAPIVQASVIDIQQTSIGKQTEADKKAIKESIKEGYEIPGAEIVKNKSITIK